MKTEYNGFVVPENGEPIDYAEGAYRVPSRPIVPFIEGDGSGRDIWKNTRLVLDAAVRHCYGGKRQIQWFEVLAGEKAFNQTAEWLPRDTIEACVDFRVSIKGPLTTPTGGGIRSINVALRQAMDLYQCIRPIKHYQGVPSPVRHPELLDVVIFRENTEDIYAGIEFQEGTAAAKKFINFVNTEMLAHTKTRLPVDAGVGLKPISIRNSKRLVHAAIEYAIATGRRVVTIVHKGNIQKFTEGAFREWGYQVAKEKFRAQIVTERESWILTASEDSSLTPQMIAAIVEPGLSSASPAFCAKVVAEVEDVLSNIGDTHGNGRWKAMIMINDRIADAIFQDLLLNPAEYSVLATTNLNGDYLSDAAAAQVGGLGISPGINIGDGYAIFEATHGTAPRLADQDVVNPSSVILCGVLLFRLLGWHEAAETVQQALEETIRQKFVTADFYKMMQGATLAKTSEFAQRVISNMG